MTFRPLFTLLLLAGCGGIPRDPDGTLERVRAERRFRVGLIAGPADPGGSRREAFLRAVGAAAGAAPAVEIGGSEPLLARLEAGELDLVVGELTPKTPWAKRVTLLPALDEQVSPDGHVHLAVAARNGENGWIALLHREAGQVAAMP